MTKFKFFQSGWATDLKTVNQDLVIKRAKRTGDGSKKFEDIDDDERNEEMPNDSGLWGWGKIIIMINCNAIRNFHFIPTDDKEMTSKERNCATILYKTVV